jgi:hypothetical protein
MDPRDDLAADVGKLSLSELEALEADVIAVGAIAPREPNASSDEADKRKALLKRENSAH